jgi:hypothetical protein
MLYAVDMAQLSSDSRRMYCLIMTVVNSSSDCEAFTIRPRSTRAVEPLQGKKLFSVDSDFFQNVGLKSSDSSVAENTCSGM